MIFSNISAAEGCTIDNKQVNNSIQALLVSCLLNRNFLFPDVCIPLAQLSCLTYQVFYELESTVFIPFV